MNEKPFVFNSSFRVHHSSFSFLPFALLFIVLGFALIRHTMNLG